VGTLGHGGGANRQLKLLLAQLDISREGGEARPQQDTPRPQRLQRGPGRIVQGLRWRGGQGGERPASPIQSLSEQ
jgi:hypothetical protein